MADYAHPEVLVDTAWVDAHKNGPGVRIAEVDVDTAAYEQGHVPGAIGWNWTTQLCDTVRRDIIPKDQYERLMGEAGIGKTTLLTQFASRVRADAGTVVWGTCWDGDQAPAWWPWTQALRALIDRNNELVQAAPPELAAIVPGELGSSRTGGGGARHQLTRGRRGLRNQGPGVCRGRPGTEQGSHQRASRGDLGRPAFG